MSPRTSQPDQDDDVLYGRTPQGQLLYDLLFARITDRWIARKHHLPVAEVRDLRKTVRAAYRKGRRIERKRNEARKQRAAAGSAPLR